MENTMVIQDRLFLIASAFFRVNNSEWVNEHELVYEDDENEIINRFGASIEKYLVITGNMLKPVFVFVLKLLSDFYIFVKGLIFNGKSNNQLFSKQTGQDNETRNYNGFYSRKHRNLFDNNRRENNDDDDVIEKIKSFIRNIFKTEEIEYQNNAPVIRRMYRGNSLE